MIAKLSYRVFPLASALIVAGLASITVAQSLVSYDVATPAGLERTWFGQVQLDVSRHRVASWKLYNDNLLALTTGGAVHSFNAETGETLWVTQVGPLDQIAAGPAANDKYVALVSGAELYVLDRMTGKFLWSRKLGSAPAAAPALSDKYAYASFLNGRIEGYQLDDHLANPWYSQSIGRIFHSPTASGQVVTWPTDRGYLYVGNANEPRVMYRIETATTATAPPSALHQLLYVTSADGHIYAFDELNGNEVWRYSMGYVGTNRPAVVGDRLYAASNEPMLHAVDAKTGEPLWAIPGITQFVAQGLKHVYGLDDLGRLVIVDVETGKYIDTLPGSNYHAVFNEQSDRVFLVTDRGLVQSLHEIGAVEPTMYRDLPVEAEKEAAPTEETAPPVEAAPAEPTVPFGDEPAAEPSPFQEEGGEDLGNPFDFGE
ncbi:MAG: PQQ-binding-like beta-propeller repeat protein [Bythopirellula sp.]|nr:PQQ-binding-like beta-propeller repeat protein [Bythopirellula sp.]